ncbi:MAG: S8 family serine peptidase [Cyclobacteriaceae bacterium]|nr:S8 family serine peptidase [Cyclobacteriaceae bacterium]
MYRLIVCVLLATNFSVQAQDKQHFRMPKGARAGDYASSHVLVKVKDAYQGEFVSGQFQKLKNGRSSLPFTAAHPLMRTGLQQRARTLKGPRLSKPQVDIGRYFSVPTNGKDVEQFVNELYATGLFELVEPEYVNRICYKPNDILLSQQYYLTLIKAEAAWDITKGSESIVIAIVDSGGQLDHPDLSSKLWSNPNDPIDGVDNDQNGYIDDNQGWDFIGNDTLNVNISGYEGDNNPAIFEGGLETHGTWVAGSAAAATDNGIGVAGVGYNTKLLFTKHSADNQKLTDGSIYFGYAGLLYAAGMGANVINLSWGGSFDSQIIQDLINYVSLDLGCLVVAAAGNDGKNAPFYPAAYDNVLAVAATDASDKKASFSNYGDFVDISAPGVAIQTTSYKSGYSQEDGTSFAAPIVSGAAALIWAHYPNYTAQQISEQLRVSADPTFYTVNSGFKKQLGKGRLDILRALTVESPSIRAADPHLVNEAGLVPVPGDKAFLSFEFQNFLSSTTSGLQIDITTSSSFVKLTKASIQPGIISAGSVLNSILTPFEMTINANVPDNAVVPIRMTFTDGAYSDTQVISFIINPTFVDVNENKVLTTMTSIGRLGYEDPENNPPAHGSGFVFEQQSLLFEMGLIMGTDSTHLSDNVRSTVSGSGSSATQNFNQSFTRTQRIKQISPGERSNNEVFGEMINAKTEASASLKLQYRSLAWKDQPNDQFIILEYKVKNISAATLNNFHFGIFADWDITTNGQQDAAGWDNDARLGYVFPAQTAAKPSAGIALLKGISAEYYAIDNNQSIAGNPFGLYDGFSRKEKMTAISSGLTRTTAGVTSASGNDVSHVVSAGPYSLAAGEETTITFALIAAANVDELKRFAHRADSLYNLTLTAAMPTVAEANTCYNTDATISASGAGAFNWYTTFTGGTPFHTGSQLTTPVLKGDTTFYVSNADQVYESVRTPAVVKVKANPTITASGNTTFCEGSSIILSVPSADSYTWSTGETTQNITVSTAGTYSVSVSDIALNCTSTSADIVVNTNPNPGSSFSVSSGELKVFTDVQFTDASTGADSYFWQFGDGSTSTDKNPVHQYTTINNFSPSLTVTNSLGCQATSSQTIALVTGIEDASASELSIYPVPAQSVIHVTSDLAHAKLSVYDNQGRVHLQDSWSSNGYSKDITISQLSGGIYVVRVTDGVKTVSRRFLKID